MGRRCLFLPYVALSQFFFFFIKNKNKDKKFSTWMIFSHCFFCYIFLFGAVAGVRGRGKEFGWNGFKIKKKKKKKKKG